MLGALFSEARIGTSLSEASMAAAPGAGGQALPAQGLPRPAAGHRLLLPPAARSARAWSAARRLRARSAGRQRRQAQELGRRSLCSCTARAVSLAARAVSLAARAVASVSAALPRAPTGARRSGVRQRGACGRGGCALCISGGGGGRGSGSGGGGLAWRPAPQQRSAAVPDQGVWRCSLHGARPQPGRNLRV